MVWLWALGALVVLALGASAVMAWLDPYDTDGESDQDRAMRAYYALPESERARVRAKWNQDSQVPQAAIDA